MTENEMISAIADLIDQMPPDLLAGCCQGGIVFRVQDFAAASDLAHFGFHGPKNMLGLFHGHDRPAPGAPANMIYIYRRAIMARAEREKYTVLDMLRYVVVHEIGHHVGFSDPELARMDAARRG